MKIFLQYIYTHLRLLIILLVIGVALGACTKHDDEQPPLNSGDYISLYSEIAPQKTRLASNNFETNESIGLYVVPFESDGYTPGVISNSAYAVNKQHIYNGTSWSLKSGGKVPWPNSLNKVDLYAYYPYSETLNTEDPTNYTFTIQRNQQTKNSYDASDFLWAKTGNVIPTTNAIGLNFSHKLSKVKINVKADLDILTALLSNASIRILNTQQEGIINLSDGSVSAKDISSVSEIAPLQVKTVTGYELSVEGIAIPQTLKSGTPFIRVEIDYNNTRYNYILTEDIALEAGKERAFNITLTKMGLSVTVDNIQDWEPTEPVEGEIGTFAPQVLDLNSIDWSKSWVHKVYNNNVQIAEVVKEYIYYSGGIDFQAIVVYPIDIDGKVDLTEGFIARVMNRTRNTITNEYEPNTNNVHGGHIGFGDNNDFYNYLDGDKSLFNKVEINSVKDIRPASDNAIITLTTEPDVLIDVDGNSYPIVKIGTQYWTKENLKVEHFKDGSDLTYYYYNDDIANKHKLGAYYTWATVMDPKGIAPDGWKVPSSDDFTSLHQYIQPDAGMKMKANTMWYSLTTGDDVTGFSGLPAGRRTDVGTYTELNYYGQWWTTSPYGTSNSAYRLYLDYSNKAMHHTILNKNYTQSVRLIRETDSGSAT